MKKAERKEDLNRMKAAAFTSWRLENYFDSLIVSLSNKEHKGQEFNDYLLANNLLTRTERKEWQTIKQLRKILQEREDKKKHNMADIIMLADKKRQKSLQETAAKRKGES